MIQDLEEKNVYQQMGVQNSDRREVNSWIWSI